MSGEIKIECEIKNNDVMAVALAGKLQAGKLKEIGQISRLLREALNGQVKGC